MAFTALHTSLSRKPRHTLVSANVVQQKHAKNFHIFFFCLQTTTLEFAAVPRKMERPVYFCFCRTSMIIFFYSTIFCHTMVGIRYCCARPLTISQHRQCRLAQAACTVAAARILRHCLTICSAWTAVLCFAMCF